MVYEISTLVRNISKVMKLVILLLILVTGGYGQSCIGRCGEKDVTKPCQCNTICEKFQDCCQDYHDVCFSCKDRCGERFLHSKPCQCNDGCSSHVDCCKDYDNLCSGSVSDAQLRELTESLLSLDDDNVGYCVIVDHQGHGSSGDLAPRPYFTYVPEKVLARPIYAALINLLDNYTPDVNAAEVKDPEEDVEEEAFLSAVMDTKLMAMTQSFLIENNIYQGNLKQKMKEIWFDFYPRGTHGVAGSSGFEHSFVGEIKHNEVSGFHNWIHFFLAERSGSLNYEGWSKTVNLHDQGEIIENHFHWLNKRKAIGGMFTGTSPAFELAVYTVCFLARKDTSCPVQMNSHRFTIETWTMKYQGKVLVGSAYPNI